MSVRDQFSYWLKAEPDPALPVSAPQADVLAALNASVLAGENGYVCMVFTAGPDGISGEVDPAKGAVEQDDGFQDAVGAIAARYPSWMFSFEERNEEDRSDAARTEWRNGQCLGTAYSRTLEPGELDRVTIDAVIAYAKSTGQAMAASMIEKHFKDVA